MKYKVVVHPQKQEDWHDMVEWCWNNSGTAEGDWKIKEYSPMVFAFKKKASAVLFALRWI